MRSVIVISEIEPSLAAGLQAFLAVNQTDVRELLRDYLNYLSKNISRRSRRVHISRELAQHPLYHNEKRAVINDICSDIENGRDLSKYLSDRANQLGHYDLCLSHYDAHHFHLGSSIAKSGKRTGRVKGSKSLIFIRFLPDDAYLLDILNHDIRAGFLNVKLMKIMHENWPEIIEPFRVKGVEGLATHYTDDEAAMLLENNVNVSLELAPKTVYMLPGIGTSTAGTPTRVEVDSIKLMDQIENIVKIIGNNKALVAAKLKDITGVFSNVIRLRSFVSEAGVCIYDATSSCTFCIEGEGLKISASNVF